MNHLEIELKSLLTKQDYTNLLSFFSDSEPVTQTNYYLDCHDFLLQKEKIVLRIRTFENSAELTIKIPQAVGNMEYNQALSLAEVEQIRTSKQLPKGQIKDLLVQKGFLQADWYFLGSLTTKRYEKETAIGLMALDESYYFDTRDYELELEVPQYQQGVLDFQNFLAKHQISYQKAPSKFVRFLEKMEKS